MRVQARPAARSERLGDEHAVGGEHDTGDVMPYNLDKALRKATVMLYHGQYGDLADLLKDSIPLAHEAHRRGLSGYRSNVGDVVVHDWYVFQGEEDPPDAHCGRERRVDRILERLHLENVVDIAGGIRLDIANGNIETMDEVVDEIFRITNESSRVISMQHAKDIAYSSPGWNAVEWGPGDPAYPAHAHDAISSIATAAMEADLWAELGSEEDLFEDEDDDA